MTLNSFTSNLNRYLDLVCDCNVPFWFWLKSKLFYDENVICLDRENVKLSSLQESDFDNCTCKYSYGKT